MVARIDTADEKKLLARQKSTERGRRWRANNPVRAVARREAWKEKNRDRVRAVDAAWAQRNKERRRAQGASRYRANAESHRAYMSVWREKNRARLSAMVAEWARRHPERRAETAAARRAAKVRAAVPWANRFFIAEAYALAKLRTTATGYPWHVDHIVPLMSDYVCGLHVEHNLRVIPGRANQSKGNRSWPDMPQREIRV